MALRRGFPDALVPPRCRELKMSRHGVRASQQVVRATWRRRHAIGTSRVRRWRRRGYCRRLWPLTAERVDPRGRDATAHQSSESLLLAVTLKLISINAAGRQPA